MQIGVHCVRGNISHDECRQCALNPLHPCDYTPDVLEEMRIDYEDEDREPGVESYTPTRILGCARQPVLMGNSDYYVNVDDAYKLVRGNMVHSLIEQAKYPGVLSTIREQRMKVEIETKFGPKTFTAKPDIIVVKSMETRVGPIPGYDSLDIHIKVIDYKSTNDIASDMAESKIDHQWQVNMYAYVASQVLPGMLFEDAERHSYEQVNVIVDEVEIAYFAMRKMRRFTSAGPRITKGKRLSVKPLVYADLELQPIMLLPMPAVGAFIRRKIEERIEAETELPDILTGDAAWRCDYCPIRDLCYSIGNRKEAA